MLIANILGYALQERKKRRERLGGRIGREVRWEVVDESNQVGGFVGEVFWAPLSLPSFSLSFPS